MVVDCAAVRFVPLYSGNIMIIFRSGTDPISLSSCSSSCSCWSNLFKKAYVSIISNRIEIKFGRIVPQVNMHRLTESDFRYDVILLRRWPWCHFMKTLFRSGWNLTWVFYCSLLTYSLIFDLVSKFHFTQKTAATWWVNMKRLAGTSS